jgi:ribosomal protein S2
LERGKDTNIVTKTKGINIHIIDIEQTIVMLRRAITFIQKISQNRGIILYVPSKLEKRL